MCTLPDDHLFFERVVSFSHMRPAFPVSRSNFPTAVAFARRGHSASNAPPPHSYAAYCAVTGERYSHQLERELFYFARQMKFTSSFWITEKRRRQEGIRLRSTGEIPFCHRSALDQSHAFNVMNAAYVEDTDLFFFFTLRPLPVRGISHGVHWVHTEGQWRAFADTDPLYPCLSKLMAHIRHLLLRNSSVRHVSSNLRSPRLPAERVGIGVKSRTHELILPHATSSGRYPEFFWFDPTAVHSHRFALFADAVWLPLSSALMSPTCMYNMDQVVPFHEAKSTAFPISP
ncbi:hypothetical protein DQ04_00361110 [Trypanosoma grayi]|uniref:hypothetical protein n=1 Tax=Trypanosoma grayi TaxID=71804 RepID=UPI0004F40BE0|nr:hypothetical protein DQ04_00361110 [Trypanosoma grayi]KEG14649.1 hypothetical protein DQ04_00361110 [Trypanosoma grayi]